MTNQYSETLIYSKERKEDIPIPADLDALMNEEPAAAFLGLTRRALQNFRLNGKGPQYVKLGERCVRYTKRNLIEYSVDNLRRSTSDQGKRERS
jgi:hypothetical protein